MQFRKYTKKQLIKAVKNSLSIRQVLQKLNVQPFGGNYHVIKRYIKNLNLDTSHFTGQLWSKGKTIGPKRPIEDYLSNKQFIASHALKKKLISEDILKHKCQKCNKTKWLGSLIPLELHHLDGDRENNNLSNLQLLCPNCHALTDNYRGKNKKNAA